MSRGANPLGVWLRQEMLKRGYDPSWGGQSRLARDAGISASSINRVLNQDYGVKLDVLRRLGKTLGYNLGEMLVFAGEADRDELPVRPPEELDTASPEPDTSPFSDPHERQIWEWDELSEEIRRHLIVSLRTALQMEAHQPLGTPASD